MNYSIYGVPHLIYRATSQVPQSIAYIQSMKYITIPNYKLHIRNYINAFLILQSYIMGSTYVHILYIYLHMNHDNHDHFHRGHQQLQGICQAISNKIKTLQLRWITCGYVIQIIYGMDVISYMNPYRNSIMPYMVNIINIYISSIFNKS